MIDIDTKKQVYIEHNNIHLSVRQAGVVCNILDNNRIPYRSANDTYLIDGIWMTNIALYNKWYSCLDLVFIQRLLDEQKETKENNKISQLKMDVMYW